MSSTGKELELELDLECSLCKDIFREPKTLGCLHSFCLECLETHYERTHSTVGLRCPICRTPFQSQSRDQLSNLSTDLYLLNALENHNSLKNLTHEQKGCVVEENEATHYCLDCEEHFCEGCAKVHQKSKATKNHQVIPIGEMKDQTQINVISKSSSQLYCQIHQSEEIKLFCEDCKEPICSLCIDKHRAHTISSLSSIMQNEKQLLIDLIKQVRPKEKKLQEGINKCEEVIKELEINSTTTQIQINQLFNKIRIKLDEKEQELLNKLEEIEKHRKKELEIQKEELKFGIESIIGSCQMIQNSISLSNKNKNDLQLISMKKLYESRLNYLSNNIWKIEPCHHSFIEFLISEKEEESIYSSILNIGVINSNEISIDKCLISRNDQQRIYENEEFKFEIISYSKEGNEMRKGGNGKRFTIQIEGESKNDKQQNNELEIIDLNNGKYEVKMKLKVEGKYSIFVKFNGVDINSSPFQIQVNSMEIKAYDKINEPKLTFGSYGNRKGQFYSPIGVAVNFNGNIIVSEYHNNRIQIFDSKGNFMSTFGSFGNGNGQFSSPIGITINSRSNIIVSDTFNHRIQIFDSEGNFISKFGSKGKGDGQFSYPEGICVDKNDRIYVCDYRNHRIQIFDLEGRFISTFGSYGNGNGQFDNPIGITIPSKGNIIVCDYGNHRIQIFDSNGKFISKFGSQGDRNGQFHGPSGICVDVNDNIFVCERKNGRVQIFNSNGEYMTQFEVNKPTDIIIDPNTQNIIVTRKDHQVSIF